MNDELRTLVDLVQRSGLSDEDKGKISRLVRITSLRARQMTGDELREARELAGLSLGQAAKLLAVSRELLAAFEADDPCPPVSVLDAMDVAYGLGVKPDEDGATQIVAV